VITTLTGENSFSLRETLHKLVDDFVVKYGDLTLERLDGEEADLSDIQRVLTSLPFLASHQLVVLRMPSKNKQFTEQFEQLLHIVPSTTDVIIIEPKLDKRLNYYKFLKNQTNFQEFLELDNRGLVHWLTLTAQEKAGSLEPGDARYLIDRIGASQQLLVHELDKLILYDPQITRQTIDLLTDPIPQSTIFQLLEAAFVGRNRETLKLYSQQRANKVEPQQIVAMLTWQLHIISIIKTAGDSNTDQIAQQASINPYVIRKSQSLARRISLIDLKKWVANLQTIDQNLKRTKIDPDEALQHYLLNLKV
jgi:DNA polymerase III delta subunit